MRSRRRPRPAAPARRPTTHDARAFAREMQRGRAADAGAAAGDDGDLAVERRRSSLRASRQTVRLVAVARRLRRVTSPARRSLSTSSRGRSSGLPQPPPPGSSSSQPLARLEHDLALRKHGLAVAPHRALRPGLPADHAEARMLDALGATGRCSSAGPTGCAARRAGRGRRGTCRRRRSRGSAPCTRSAPAPPARTSRSASPCSSTGSSGCRGRPSSSARPGRHGSSARCRRRCRRPCGPGS